MIKMFPLTGIVIEFKSIQLLIYETNIILVVVDSFNGFVKSLTNINGVYFLVFFNMKQYFLKLCLFLLNQDIPITFST